eukprot:Anaeramoba_flamelloidesa85813_30.p12 GENE.a85813_30~~a85813_30.p12  ORF type:complete len:173 (-),score=13.68 a85813_30:1941-2459(-)
MMWRLVDDDTAPGLAHRSHQGGMVDRVQRGDVDYFAADALIGQPVGGGQGFADHGAPADQGDVTAFAQGEAGIQRQRLAVVLHQCLAGAVDPLGFEKDYWIVTTDCSQQQAVGPCRGRRDHDPQSRDVGEQGFGALGVVLGRMDAAAEGRAQHHRAAEPATGTVAHTSSVGH